MHSLQSPVSYAIQLLFFNYFFVWYYSWESQYKPWKVDNFYRTFRKWAPPTLNIWQFSCNIHDRIPLMLSSSKLIFTLHLNEYFAIIPLRLWGIWEIYPPTWFISPFYCSFKYVIIQTSLAQLLRLVYCHLICSRKQHLMDFHSD